ncbi:MAG: hypothetical protein P1V97_01255 [Planctomycetota bacterium]|nr:hypothetical protein [Planctomycetota bacterium]
MVKEGQLLLAVLVVSLIAGCGSDDFDDISDTPRAGTKKSNELDDAFERTPLEIPLPYTPDAVKKAMKVGQISIFKTHQIIYAPKKEEEFTLFEKEILEVGDKFFKARITPLNWDTGAPLGESKVNKGAYDQAKVTYSQFKKDETQIFDQDVEMAGRVWKTRVYKNLQVVDFQEQRLTIWNSLEYPGLTLKMVFKSPRRATEIKLVKFHDPK